MKYEFDLEKLLTPKSKQELLWMLEQMFRIRHFETQAEAAYNEGLVAGFFHSYVGQEAIQVGAVAAVGAEQAWWITGYRCHALALLTGCSLVAGMAELFGKRSGCAGGKGGSMHFVTDSMPLGDGIVGGHLPIALGFAFANQYLNQNKATICFLGDGAVAQGLFHESLNLAALWKLPVIYVIENNQWGMGTHVKRALAPQSLCSLADPFHIPSYSVDGMDVMACFDLFSHLVKERGGPILVEAHTERFRGHSRSDTEIYRTKEEVKKLRGKCPIHLHTKRLVEANILTQEEVEQIDRQVKEEVLQAMEKAKREEDPDASFLEKDVYGEGV